MITHRRSHERGHADHGWLDTRFSFSFAHYYDPAHLGFRSLRVINEDFIEGGKGFGTHPHNDMEIITYILEGSLAHKDSMGNGSTIEVGDVQRMSAGTGVTHSEFNPHPEVKCHLLQIWIFPKQQGIEPSYEQTHFDIDDKAGRLRLVASPDGSDGSVTIHQDARLYASVMEKGEDVRHELAEGRGAWVQIARGAVTLNGEAMEQGDGAAIESESELTIAATQRAEVLLFDLG